MQQPPPGYGPPQYQQPQYQQPQQMPPQPPPKKGMSPVMMVLAVIGGIVVLGFGGCVVCVGVGAKGVADQKKAADVAATAGRATATSVAVDRLLADYKANEVRADGLYKGKYLTVSGTVGDVKKDIMDSMYVTVGTGKVFEIPEIQCHLNADQTARASALSKGSKVTVVGRADGLMMHVQFRDCEIQ